MRCVLLLLFFYRLPPRARESRVFRVFVDSCANCAVIKKEKQVRRRRYFSVCVRAVYDLIRVDASPYEHRRSQQAIGVLTRTNGFLTAELTEHRGRKKL